MVLYAQARGGTQHFSQLLSLCPFWSQLGHNGGWGRQVLNRVTWEVGRQCLWSALAGQWCPAGTLWNLSSYEPLKMVIIDHGLQTLTHEVIVPHSGWEREPNEDSKPRDAEWTTVFKNTSGCLRWGPGWAWAPPSSLPGLFLVKKSGARHQSLHANSCPGDSHVLVSQIR